MDPIIDTERELLEGEYLEGVDMMAAANCGPVGPGGNSNCSECYSILTDANKRNAFGYHRLDRARCECHDICVQDVKAISVERRNLRYCIPATPDGHAGCRGGFSPECQPTVQSFRVLCAEGRLSPNTGCDRIINEIEFEVVLCYGNTLVVVNPKDIFECFWYEFARFPSGVFFANSPCGLNDFRKELALIDGCCKVIIVENIRIVGECNSCVLEIRYKVIDKLWKEENLLVSAIKPYSSNLTVNQEFAQGHKIGPCRGNGFCCED